ncbi:hypothetical protein GCM10008960_35010 [Deinococcus sedimenti]|uniref:Uncharacterized protein n=1 Tax=Deinococcus sedimenti TaxID=1867090 RepID=A0ABQ2S7K7_9DEIO|nr:hypothetical protein GCM10008960_35010 [Deinococcus sedimenti]
MGDETGFGVESWSAQVPLPEGALQALDELSDGWTLPNEVSDGFFNTWRAFEGVALMGVASSMDGSRVVFAHSRVMQWAQTLSYFILLLRVAEERLPDSWVRSRVARTHFMLQPDLSHRR